MTSKIQNFAIYCLFAASAYSALACPNGKSACSQHQTGGMSFLDYADELKMTDAQVAKINKLRLSSERDWKQLHLKTELAQDELLKASHDPQSDRKKIEKAIDAVSQAEKELLKSEAFAILDARDVLNADQLKKLREQSGSSMKPCCHGEAKKE